MKKKPKRTKNDAPDAPDAPDQRMLDRRNAFKRSAWVSVLNDDDTYAGLDGCWIAPTTQAQVKAFEEGEMHVTDLPNPFSLNALLMAAIDGGLFDEWLDEHPERFRANRKGKLSFS